MCSCVYGLDCKVNIVVYCSGLMISRYILKAELLLLKLLQLFARDILAMKKLDIEKTKPTFIISVLKVEN